MLSKKHKADLQTRSAGQACESTFGGAAIAVFCVKKSAQRENDFTLCAICSLRRRTLRTCT